MCVINRVINRGKDTRVGWEERSRIFPYAASSVESSQGGAERILKKTCKLGSFLSLSPCLNTLDSVLIGS